MILRDLTMPRLALAIELNLIEEMAWFGSAHPMGELHKTPELVWIANSQGPNAVLYSAFTSSEPSYISSQIDRLCQFYGEKQLSFSWTTGLSTRPAALSEMLEARRFIYQNSTTGMAVEIQTVHTDLPTNQELTISEVEDLQDLEHLRGIEMQGFDATEQGAQFYYETYLHAGFGRGSPWHHYIGRLRGEPVASASLLYHAGVAGIYGVATIPSARRQGVGTAMTLHVLNEARKLGFQVAILSPTDMSEAIYRRMGFRDYCALKHYHYSAGA